MIRALALVAGCSVLAVSGLAHGLWTGRWTASRTLEEAVARLDQLPPHPSGWTSQPLLLPAEEMAGARVAGYCARRYENRRKGQSVTVLLVCGRPGPVAVHNPEVCYPDVGYQLMDGPVSVALGPVGPVEGANFQASTFARERSGPGTGGQLRIFWAWNAGGQWETPDNPRWSFARCPALYKLYVIRQTRPKEKGRLEEDPCVDFLKVFLPELQQGLFPAPAR